MSFSRARSVLLLILKYSEITIMIYFKQTLAVVLETLTDSLWLVQLSNLRLITMIRSLSRCIYKWIFVHYYPVCIALLMSHTFFFYLNQKLFPSGVLSTLNYGYIHAGLETSMKDRIKYLKYWKDKKEKKKVLPTELLANLS